jgi:hypothetical protein
MSASEFLLLNIGESARVGGTVRVVGVAASEQGAHEALEGLDPSVLGRIALVEVKQHFERRPAVQSIPVAGPIFTD